MRVRAGLAVLIGLTVGARAQTPLAPPTPLAAPPPSAPQTPAPAAPVVTPAPAPAAPQEAAPAGASPAPAPAVPPQNLTPAPPALTWEKHGAAVLQVLDKVNATSSPITVAVGSAQTVGTISIAVKGCFARPVDQPPDATAYVTVTGAGGASVFSGWLLAAEPSASMMQDPVYDVRVTGCQ